MRSGRSTGDLFDPASSATPQSRHRPPARPRPAPRPVAVPEAKQLWLCLQLPALALTAVTPAPRPLGALAVVDGIERRQTVVACSAEATARGIEPGLPLTAALTLCPGLQVLERRAEEEVRQLEALARLGHRYTPVVCLQPPDELLLEVRASRRLFGGLPTLLSRFLTECTSFGHVIKLGLAPTAQGARWLARAGDSVPVESPALLTGRLSALPINCTRWPADTLQALTRFGLSRLGELARLPRDGLSRRLPEFVLQELDAAFGRTPTVHSRYVAPERFSERIDCELPAEHLPDLEPLIDRLLRALERFLEVRGAAVATLTLSFEHRGLTASRVTVNRARPGAAARDWQLLLKERLNSLALTAPVSAVRLRSGVLGPLATATASLPGMVDPKAAAAEAGTLLDRLQARLGDQAVSGLCLIPEHRPEAAVRHIAPGIAPRGGASPEVPQAARPLWLLAEPEPLPLRDDRPWSDGPLEFESGPERIESGWWDGQEVRRDYYIARTGSGVRLWLYRSRSDNPAGAAGRWFLHGVFA